MCIRMHSRKSTERRQGGLTMVELILFIVIVSVGIVGILQVLNLSSRYSADPLPRKQALAIAEALLEEVELARFTFCDPADDNAEKAAGTGECTTVPEKLGPEQGNARPFDNVNDYVTAFGVPQAAFNNGAGRLVDVNGVNLPVDGAYTATLTLTPEPLGNPSISSIAGSGSPPDTANLEVLRITVTVNYGKESITLDGYRTRYAPTALP